MSLLSQFKAGSPSWNSLKGRQLEDVFAASPRTTALRTVETHPGASSACLTVLACRGFSSKTGFTKQPVSSPSAGPSTCQLPGVPPLPTMARPGDLANRLDSIQRCIPWSTAVREEEGLLSRSAAVVRITGNMPVTNAG